MYNTENKTKCKHTQNLTSNSYINMVSLKRVRYLKLPQILQFTNFKIRKAGIGLTLTSMSPILFTALMMGRPTIEGKI